MRNLIAAMILATVSAMGQAASSSFQGLSYSTSGEVVPGQWTAQYAKAKAAAKSKNVPLVAVFVRPTCTFCKNLGSALASSSVSSWAEKRGYYFVIGVEDTTSEASSVLTFARKGSALPFVGVWWPKDKSGKSVQVQFNGRSGLMPVTSGSLAQQFMDSVDGYVGDYADVPPKYSKVTFDPRDGTIDSSDKTRSVVTGKAVGSLPSVSKSGYKFLGWFTGSSGGDRVSSSTVIAKSVTFYAHWAKVYSLTVTCSPKAGGSVSGAGSFAEGESFALKATAKSGYVFSGWRSRMGRLSQETTYKGVMGSADLSLTAEFIKKTDDWVKIGAFKPAVEYETKKEIVPIALSATGGSLPTLSVSKLPSGLKFTAKAITGHAANTIYGTPTKSGIYSAQVTAKTVGGAKASAILPLVVRAKNERIIAVDCDASMGKVSGGGVFADGKKASVRATALSKRCFTGWSVGGTLVSRSASYSYPVDGNDVTLIAGFVSKEQDLASISLALNGAVQVATHVPTNVVRCGVSNNWTVVAKADSGTSVAASGLPSGLKLVKTLVNKELKDYAYEIVGVPTSASRIDSKTKLPKPTVSTIKVTTLGKSSVSYKVAFIVEALPSWAYGTFNGFAAADEHDEHEEHGKGAGVATMTVSSGGKISGKFGLFGTNWTYSATGYTVFVNAKDPAKMKFGFEAVAKYSKLKRPFVVEITPGACNCSVADGEGDDFAFTMYRKVWSDKPALATPKLAKTSLQALGYDKLALTVSSSGKATFAGKLGDGTSASSSSTVFVDEEGLYKVYLIIPATKKYGGYIDLIDFSSLK